MIKLINSVMLSVFDLPPKKDVLETLCKSAQLCLDKKSLPALERLLTIDDKKILRGTSSKLIVDNIVGGNIDKVAQLLTKSKEFAKDIIERTIMYVYKNDVSNLITITQLLCESNSENMYLYLCSLLLGNDFDQAKIVASAIKTTDNHAHLAVVYTKVFNDEYIDSDIDNIVAIYKTPQLYCIDTLLTYCIYTSDLHVELFFKVVERMLAYERYYAFVKLMELRDNDHHPDKRYNELVKQFFLKTGIEGFEPHRETRWGKKYSKMCVDGTIDIPIEDRYKAQREEELNKTLDASEIVKLAREGKKEEVLKMLNEDKTTDIEQCYAMAKVLDFDELITNFKGSGGYWQFLANGNIISALKMNGRNDEAYRMFKRLHGEKPRACAFHCRCIEQFDTKDILTDYIYMSLSDANAMTHFNGIMKTIKKYVDVKDYKKYIDMVSGNYKKYMLISFAGFHLDGSIFEGKKVHREIED